MKASIFAIHWDGIWMVKSNFQGTAGMGTAANPQRSRLSVLGNGFRFPDGPAFPGRYHAHLSAVADQRMMPTHEGGAARDGAGVRKPPREETAGDAKRAMRIRSHSESHIVELDDGSRWQIFPGDLDLTLGWKPETELSIVPTDDEIAKVALPKVSKILRAAGAIFV
jgi:hypothetical protein